MVIIRELCHGSVVAAYNFGLVVDDAAIPSRDVGGPARFGGEGVECSVVSPLAGYKRFK